MEVGFRRSTMKSSFSRVFSLLALFCSSASCKYSAEEVVSMYYDLAISSFPINEDTVTTEGSNNAAGTEAGGTSSNVVSLGISNKYGQKYNCRVPIFTEPPAGSTDRLLDPPASSKVTNEDIQNDGGWWTYEFCYKRGISQYHLGSNNEVEGESISLGVFESEKNWMREEAMAELKEKRKHTLVHTHTYTNGTLCDLTGRGRRAEVRFVCDENSALANDAYLYSVDEPESCEYVLVVRTGALCRLSAFLPVDKKPPPVNIQCQPVLPAPDFEAYVKEKEAAETRRQEEAAAKKKQEKTKQKVAQEMKPVQVETKKETLSNSPSEPQKKKKTDGGRGTATPLVEILGKSKRDYLKMTDEREKKSAGAEGTPSGDTVPSAKVEEATTFETNIGAEGTIEYEYMTHWLEQELENLANDEEVTEADKQVDAAKGLSDMEKYAVNEFKRKTRQLSILTTFNARLEVVTDDFFDDIMWWEKKLAHLGKKDQFRAKHEITVALTKALTNLISQLDDTEREMELLEDKTDISGMAAFKEMREVAEKRKQLMEELSNSGLSASDFVKAKLKEMAPVTLPTTEKKRLEDLWKELTSGKKSTEYMGTDENKEVVDEQRIEAPSGADVKSKGTSKVGAQSTDAASTPDKETVHEPHGVHASQSQKSMSREEMEAEIDNIMSDVKKEFSYDEFDDEEIAAVKLEALKSLAKTLATLLERLDETEAKYLKQHQNDDDEDEDETVERKKSRKYSPWHALLKELEEPESSVKDDQQTHKPFGAIEGSGKADQKKRKKDEMRVRVSTIKKAGTTGNEGQSVGQNTPELSKLEQRIAQKLQEAGFDTQDRPVRVKILSTEKVHDNGGNSLHALSDEEAEHFSNVVFNILGGGTVEQTSEQRRHKSLEQSYNFGAEDGDDSKEESRGSPMKTVVTGDGR